MLQEPINII